MIVTMQHKLDHLHLAKCPLPFALSPYIVREDLRILDEASNHQGLKE
jgi:hypothetical protein